MYPKIYSSLFLSYFKFKQIDPDSDVQSRLRRIDYKDDDLSTKSRGKLINYSQSFIPIPCSLNQIQRSKVEDSLIRQSNNCEDKKHETKFENSSYIQYLNISNHETQNKIVCENPQIVDSFENDKIKQFTQPYSEQLTGTTSGAKINQIENTSSDQPKESPINLLDEQKGNEPLLIDTSFFSNESQQTKEKEIKDTQKEQQCLVSLFGEEKNCLHDDVLNDEESQESNNKTLEQSYQNNQISTDKCQEKNDADGQESPQKTNQIQMKSDQKRHYFQPFKHDDLSEHEEDEVSQQEIICLLGPTKNMDEAQQLEIDIIRKDRSMFELFKDLYMRVSLQEISIEHMFKILTQRYPQIAHFHYALGEIYFFLFEYDLCIENTKKYLKIVDEESSLQGFVYPFGLYQLGYSQAKLGDFFSGKENVLRAINRFPCNLEFQEGLDLIQRMYAEEIKEFSYHYQFKEYIWHNANMSLVAQSILELLILSSDNLIFVRQVLFYRIFVQRSLQIKSILKLVEILEDKKCVNFMIELLSLIVLFFGNKYKTQCLQQLESKYGQIRNQNKDENELLSQIYQDKHQVLFGQRPQIKEWLMGFKDCTIKQFVEEVNVVKDVFYRDGYVGQFFELSNHFVVLIDPGIYFFCPKLKQKLSEDIGLGFARSKVNVQGIRCILPGVYQSAMIDGMALITDKIVQVGNHKVIQFQKLFDRKGLRAYINKRKQRNYNKIVENFQSSQECEQNVWDTIPYNPSKGFRPYLFCYTREQHMLNLTKKDQQIQNISCEFSLKEILQQYELNDRFTKHSNVNLTIDYILHCLRMKDQIEIQPNIAQYYAYDFYPRFNKTKYSQLTINELDKENMGKYIEGFIVMAPYQTMSQQFLISDSYFDVINVELTKTLDKNQFEKNFKIGQKITILNPRLKIALNGRENIKVDNLSSIFIEDCSRYLIHILHMILKVKQFNYQLSIVLEAYLEKACGTLKTIEIECLKNSPIFRRRLQSQINEKKSEVEKPSQIKGKQESTLKFYPTQQRLQTFEKILGIDTSNPNLIRIYKNLMDKDNKDVSFILMRIGSLYYIEQEFQMSAKYLDLYRLICIQRGIHFEAKLFQELGLSYSKSNRFNDAEISLKQAIQIEKQNIGYHLSLAGVYYDFQHYSECQEICVKILKEPFRPNIQDKKRIYDKLISSEMKSKKRWEKISQFSQELIIIDQNLQDFLYKKFQSAYSSEKITLSILEKLEMDFRESKKFQVIAEALDCLIKTEKEQVPIEFHQNLGDPKIKRYQNRRSQTEQPIEEYITEMELLHKRYPYFVSSFHYNNADYVVTFCPKLKIDQQKLVCFQNAAKKGFAKSKIGKSGIKFLERRDSNQHCYEIKINTFEDRMFCQNPVQDGDQIVLHFDQVATNHKQLNRKL